MIFRIFLIVPVALIVWWFSFRIARPDEHNWVWWLMTADTSLWWKAGWGLISFAGTVAIGGSIALFVRRSWIAFFALAVVAYLFANAIGTGFRASGHAMSLATFGTLFLGMAASYPLTFSSMIAGKQIDVIGNGK